MDYVKNLVKLFFYHTFLSSTQMNRGALEKQRAFIFPEILR